MALFLKSQRKPLAFELNAVRLNIGLMLDSGPTKIENQEVREVNRWKNLGPKDSNYYTQPWWLVFLIGLVLLLFGMYIGKTNATISDQEESFWAFFKKEDATIVVPDSLISKLDTVSSWEGSFLGTGSSDILPDTTIIDEWATPSPNQGAVADSDREVKGTLSDLKTPIPVPANQTTSYHIVAGEFKQKPEATRRLQELRQGNYSAKLMAPSDQGGMYRVVVGEFKNQKTAQTEAKALGFILEIKTRVEKKEN